MRLDIDKVMHQKLNGGRFDSVNSGGTRNHKKGIGFHTSRIVDANSVEPKLLKSTFKK